MVFGRSNFPSPNIVQKPLTLINTTRFFFKFCVITSLGDGLNDVSFTPGLSRGSFGVGAPAELPPNLSLEQSWAFYNYIGGGPTGLEFMNTVRNPNKAVVTINARNSEVR